MTDRRRSSLWWISFASSRDRLRGAKSGFRGATVVRATDPASALSMVNAAHINPGGQALIIRVPKNAEISHKPLILKLLSDEEARDLDRKHPELVKANRHLKPERYVVCQDCNEAQMISCVHKQ